jgi:hypothetical protein
VNTRRAGIDLLHQVFTIVRNMHRSCFDEDGSCLISIA